MANNALSAGVTRKKKTLQDISTPTVKAQFPTSVTNQYERMTVEPEPAPELPKYSPTEMKVLKGGNVNYTVKDAQGKNQIFELSKEENETYTTGRGLMTDKLKQLKKLETGQRILNQENRKADFQELYNSFLGIKPEKSAEQKAYEKESALLDEGILQQLTGVLPKGTSEDGGFSNKGLFKAALASGVPAAIGGSAAASVAGGPVGIAVGTAYALSKALTKLEIDQAKQISDNYAQFGTSKQIMNDLISSAELGGNPRELVEKWNQQKQIIANTKSFLKSKTQGSVNAFLGDAGKELTEITAWESQLDYLDKEFARALIAPKENNPVPLG